MTKEKINKTSCSGISSRLNSHLLHNVLLANNHLGLKQPHNMGPVLYVLPTLLRDKGSLQSTVPDPKTPPVSLTTL